MTFQLRDKVHGRGVAGIISGIILDGTKSDDIAYIVRAGDCHLLCSANELESVE